MSDVKPFAIIGIEIPQSVFALRADVVIPCGHEPHREGHAFCPSCGLPTCRTRVFYTPAEVWAPYLSRGPPGTTGYMAATNDDPETWIAHPRGTGIAIWNIKDSVTAETPAKYMFGEPVPDRPMTREEIGGCFERVNAAGKRLGLNGEAVLYRDLLFLY